MARGRKPGHAANASSAGANGPCESDESGESEKREKGMGRLLEEQRGRAFSRGTRKARLDRALEELCGEFERRRRSRTQLGGVRIIAAGGNQNQSRHGNEVKKGNENVAWGKNGAQTREARASWRIFSGASSDVLGQGAPSPGGLARGGAAWENKGHMNATAAHARARHAQNDPDPNSRRERRTAFVASAQKRDVVRGRGRRLRQRSPSRAGRWGRRHVSESRKWNDRLDASRQGGRRAKGCGASSLFGPGSKDCEGRGFRAHGADLGDGPRTLALRGAAGPQNAREPGLRFRSKKRADVRGLARPRGLRENFAAFFRLLGDEQTRADGVGIRGGFWPARVPADIVAAKRRQRSRRGRRDAVDACGGRWRRPVRGAVAGRKRPAREKSRRKTLLTMRWRFGGGRRPIC